MLDVQVLCFPEQISANHSRYHLNRNLFLNADRQVEMKGEAADEENSGAAGDGDDDVGGTAAAREMGNPATLLEQGRFAVGGQWTAAFEQEFEDYDLKRSYSEATHFRVNPNARREKGGTTA